MTEMRKMQTLEKLHKQEQEENKRHTRTMNNLSEHLKRVTRELHKVHRRGGESFDHRRGELVNILDGVEESIKKEKGRHRDVINSITLKIKRLSE